MPYHSNNRDFYAVMMCGLVFNVTNRSSNYPIDTSQRVLVEYTNHSSTYIDTFCFIISIVDMTSVTIPVSFPEIIQLVQNSYIALPSIFSYPNTIKTICNGVP